MKRDRVITTRKVKKGKKKDRGRNSRGGCVRWGEVGLMNGCVAFGRWWWGMVSRSDWFKEEDVRGKTVKMEGGCQTPTWRRGRGTTGNSRFCGVWDEGDRGSGGGWWLVGPWFWVTLTGLWAVMADGPPEREKAEIHYYLFKKNNWILFVTAAQGTSPLFLTVLRLSVVVGKFFEFSQHRVLFRFSTHAPRF